MSEEQEYGILPYNVQKIDDRYLIVTETGDWCFLDEGDFRSLNKLEVEESLKEKLVDSNIALTKNNLRDVLGNFRDRNLCQFIPPSLHILVLSSRCNLDCVYCQAKPTDAKGYDMDKETALEIIKFIYRVPRRQMALEIQGGEPLLNWGVIEYIIKITNAEPNLRRSLVTNLTLMDDEKLDYLIENDLYLCTSLDGPKKVHNRNRPFKRDAEVGTYDQLVSTIDHIKEEYEKRKLPDKLNALPTITRFSLDYPKEIVDEYVEHGFKSLHLRPLHYLGKAKRDWDKIGYSSEEFLSFWKKALDYLIEINDEGYYLEERMSKMMLKKILFANDPAYTELMNPCGAGTSQLLYNPNGEIFTCDEGRMMDEDMFRIGNVFEDNYHEVMKNDGLFATCQASLLQNYCTDCAYKPFCGTCPVLNMSEQGNVLPKITQSMRCQIYKGQFTYLFNRLRDSKSKEVFYNWFENG